MNAVNATFVLLACLIAIAPELLFVEGTIIDALIVGIVAAAITIVARTVHADELRRLARLVRPISVIALVPGIWMLLQISPIPGRWFAHPVWLSAASALGKPIAGVITIDVGATLLCFGRYLCFLGIVIIATAVALERQRAAFILFLLAGVSALVAAALMSSDFGFLRLASLELSSKRPEALVIVVLGLILSGAAVIRAYERHDARQPKTSASRITLAATIPLSTLAFVICLAVLIINSDGVLLVAALFGTGTLLAIAIIRRLRLGWWGQSGAIAITLLGMIGFVATRPGIAELKPTLVLSTQAHHSLEAAERMLSDAPWTGTGAGTFAALLPIYRDRIGAEFSSSAPTMAASVAIEMGQPILWFLVVTALIYATVLFRAALRRSRDFFYASAGAGCLVTLVILSFSNAGDFGPAVSILAGVTFGLALAQRKKRQDLIAQTAMGDLR